jgi:hypothetical protein
MNVLKGKKIASLTGIKCQQQLEHTQCTAKLQLSAKQNQRQKPESAVLKME